MKTKGLILALAAVAAVAAAPSAPSRFTVVEASITDLQRALQQRRMTSRDLVQQSLTRIALYEDRLNAIITVNPRALAEADAMDKERAAGKVRGPGDTALAAFQASMRRSWIVLNWSMRGKTSFIQNHWMTAASSTDVGVSALYSRSLGWPEPL